MLTGSTGMYQAARLLAVAFAAAQLSVREMAWWNAAQAISVYALSIQLGLFNGISIELPSSIGRRAEVASGRMERTGWAAALLGALLLGLAGVVLAVSGVFEQGGSGTLVVVLAALMCGSLLIFDFAQRRTVSWMRFPALSAQQLAAAMVILGLTIVLTPRWGLTGLLGAFIAGWLAGSLTGLLWPPAIGTPVLDRGMARSLVVVGFPIHLVGLAQAVLVSSDRWVLLRMGTPEMLGEYTPAILVFTGLGVLPGIISQQFYPRMAQAYAAQPSPDVLRSMVRQQTWLSLAVCLAAAVAVALLMPLAVRTWLPQFTGGIRAAQILGLGSIGLAVAGAAGNGLTVVGERTAYLRLLAVGVVITVLMQIAAAFLDGGLTGIATASAAGQLAVGLLLMARYRGLGGRG